MYATRARQARPEPFTVHPGIAERLGLPYLDMQLGLAAAGLAAFSLFTLGQATLHDVPGSPTTSSTGRRSTRSPVWSACTCSLESTTPASGSCGWASTHSCV